MVVREEEPQDRQAVRYVNLAAFETAAEANLVVSLAWHAELNLMGLAPMAVMPAHQRKGVGPALVRAGLERRRALGVGAVAVLGHPSYYPRFGFQPSVRFGIHSGSAMLRP